MRTILSPMLVQLIAIAAILNRSDAFKLPLPGGKAIHYNEKSGVLRIQLSTPPPALSTISSSSTIDSKILKSIQVRDTGIPAKGFGAFATEKIRKDTFLGFYEGELIKTREALDEIVEARKTANAMDYVMALDGGVTFLDGFKRFVCINHPIMITLYMLIPRSVSFKSSR